MRKSLSPWMTRNGGAPSDRKSTRLNSSHSSISYAVFCLKKKKKSTREMRTDITINFAHAILHGLGGIFTHEICKVPFELSRCKRSALGFLKILTIVDSH